MDATTKKHEPYRPCRFAVGQLVTCAGPFNSGRDDEGYWRRVEEVAQVRWDGAFLPVFWRVAVPGFSAPDYEFAPAPSGAKAGDIIRIGGFGD